MDTTAPRTQRSRMPWGLLGMVAVVALVEARIPTWNIATNDVSVAWSMAGRAASHQAKRADILFFGDSLVEFGVIPTVIEKALWLRAYNLALPGGSPESSYFLLRRAIEAGARPRAVVVDFMPYQLRWISRLESLRARNWPELADLRDLLDLAWSWRDPDLAASTLLAKGLPSVRSRHEIRGAIFADLEDRALDGQDRVFLARHNLAVNRGAKVVPDGLRPGPHSEPDLPDYRGVPARVKLDYVDRFLRLAASRNIVVFWLVPPISPEFQEVADAMGVDAEYSELLQTELATHGNLIVLDARKSGYGASLFLDQMHLARRGATAMSADIARAIGSASATERRSGLPRYREHPPSPYVTDVFESAVSLGIGPIETRRR